jgi:hypothetical protein
MNIYLSKKGISPLKIADVKELDMLKESITRIGLSRGFSHLIISGKSPVKLEE